MNLIHFKITVIIILTGSTLACNQQPTASSKKSNQPYNITGFVKNIPSGMIYMNMMQLDSAGHPSWPVIDSAKYENGKFEMKGDTILVEPAWSTNLYYIDSLTGKKKFLGINNPFESKPGKPSIHIGLILENADITYEGDEKDPSGLILKGSPETNFNFQYSLMDPPYHLTGPINKKIDALEAKGDTIGLELLKSQKALIIDKYKASFKKIIKANPDRFQALKNLLQNAEHFSIDEVDQMLNEFKPAVLQYPTASKLKTYIKKERSLLPGAQFPDFTYTDRDGKKWSLHDIKGKENTLVIFWASWCGPCRQEIPELKELQKKYAAKGLALVSISIDNNIEAWKKAMSQENMSWPNLANLPGNYKEIMTEFNISYIPKMFLLDKDMKTVLASPRNLYEVTQALPKVE